MASFKDPRSCLNEFLQTGRNLGKRPPSFSLRNVQRDIRSAKTRIENIGDRVEGAIGAAARGEFLPGQLLSITNEFRCPPTHHSMLFSQHRPPKFKFMFFAGVELQPEFATAFNGHGEHPGGEVYWYIKQAARPNISYEYEDVNMYNFRQKVLRRAIFEPVQMQMYDDLRDASHSFWNTFLRIQSPVTNIGLGNFSEERGMNWNVERSQQNLPIIRSSEGEVNFAETNMLALNNSSGTGVLPGASENKQIIKAIRLYHLINWGRQVIVYEYVNPRINEIRLDELTWESSDPSTIDVTFEFDTFHILFPRGFSEEEINAWQPSAYPINFNMDETPIGALNTGLKKFSDTVGSGVAKAKEIAGGLF